MTGQPIVRASLVVVVAMFGFGCHGQAKSVPLHNPVQIALFIDMYNYLDKRPLESVSTDDELKDLGRRMLSVSDVVIIDFGYYRFVIIRSQYRELKMDSEKLIGDAVIVNTQARQYAVWLMSKS